MVSLKALIDHRELNFTNAFRRVISIVLEGIALNAFPAGLTETKSFQATIEGLRNRFGEADNEDALILLSVSVVRALEQWSLMAEKISAGQKEQMKNTIDLLSSSLIRVSHGSEKSAKSLKIIQGELESACRMDDLAAVNAKLRLCVKEICDEAERQSRRQSAIQNDLKDAVKLAPAASDVDAVTGLASVQSAIQAIHQSWESGEDTHLLAFGIERMQSINLRFGFHVGDQIMLLFAQHLAQHMDQADTLYRWRGPCFVAVSPRRVPVAMLTSIAAKVMGTRLTHTITVGEREIVVPIVGAWSVLKLSPTTSFDALIGRLDEFSVQRTAAG